MKRWNRREFLWRTAAAASGCGAAPWLIPASAIGRDGAVEPSERITLGFIGVGMMGRGHVRVCSSYPESQILAVCDVDQWRREDAKISVEQAYAATRTSGEYKGCATYNDLRELLARDDIDAVVIATGDRWHALATVLSAKAGKDIYCEKPVSLTIHEARTMVELVRRYERVFQTGLQQRSTPEFIKACELVQRGRIGQVKYVYVSFPGTCGDVNLPAEPVPEGLDWDRWLGPAPWRPFNARFHYYGKPPRVVPWHFCRDFGGQNLTSNTVHAFDVVQWGLGMDESGPVDIVPPETGQVPSLTYKYADGVQLQVDLKLDASKHFVPKGWDVKTPIERFGALFVGEEGWIHVGRSGYLKGYPVGILETPPGEADPFRPVTNHHQNWLRCIRSRQRPACDVEIGCRSTMVAHLGCIAHWTGRALKWDPATEQFLDDDEANRLRCRDARTLDDLTTQEEKTMFRNAVPIFVVLAAIVCLGGTPSAVLADEALDKAFDALKSYDWGKDRAVLQPIDAAVAASHKDATARKALETRLAEIVKANAPRAAKDAACRHLSLIGTAASVPTVASLLGDEKLSHMARYALERIPDAAAVQALREALKNAQGRLKVGIINSLGVRRDAKSVAALTVLLKDSDKEIASAAAGALGSIGTPEAAKALTAFQAKAPEELQLAAADACLACAERLLDGGKKQEAVAIYKSLGKPGQLPHVRVAAKRGLFAAMK